MTHEEVATISPGSSLSESSPNYPLPEPLAQISKREFNNALFKGYSAASPAVSSPDPSSIDRQPLRPMTLTTPLPHDLGADSMVSVSLGSLHCDELQ